MFIVCNSTDVSVSPHILIVKRVGRYTVHGFCLHPGRLPTWMGERLSCNATRTIRKHGLCAKCSNHSDTCDTLAIHRIDQARNNFLKPADLAHCGLVPTSLHCCQLSLG